MKDKLVDFVVGILVVGMVILGMYVYNRYFDNPSSTKSNHTHSKGSNASGITNPSSRYYDPIDEDNRDDEDDVYYENCSEARADGAESIREGEPGYREELDRDGDGIACEPWHGR
jgi:hypothetical protein